MAPSASAQFVQPQLWSPSDPPQLVDLTAQPFVHDYHGVPIAPDADLVPPLRVDHQFALAGTDIVSQRVEDEEEYETSYGIRIGAPPSVQFARETWWDALLSFYAGAGSAPPEGALPVAARDAAARRVAADLRFLFELSLHWFSFVHIPRFYGALFDPRARGRVQPALVLAALALATFFQSSELERGARGRRRALQLLDQAHATFDASLCSGWVDVGLVQAAWVRALRRCPSKERRMLTTGARQMLAMFELQAHPRTGCGRAQSAFRVLDSLVRGLGLTTLDAEDPRASIFLPGAVPVVPDSGLVPACAPAAPPRALVPQLHGHAEADLLAGYVTEVPGVLGQGDNGGGGAGKWRCGCGAYALGSAWPRAWQLAPAWATMPMWPEEAGEGALAKEECRRVVWAAMMLTVSHNTKTTAGTDRETQHLYIKDPANVSRALPLRSGPRREQRADAGRGCGGVGRSTRCCSPGSRSRRRGWAGCRRRRTRCGRCTCARSSCGTRASARARTRRSRSRTARSGRRRRGSSSTASRRRWTATRARSRRGS